MSDENKNKAEGGMAEDEEEASPESFAGPKSGKEENYLEKQIESNYVRWHKMFGTVVEKLIGLSFFAILFIVILILSGLGIWFFHVFTNWGWLKDEKFRQSKDSFLMVLLGHY